MSTSISTYDRASTQHVYLHLGMSTSMSTSMSTYYSSMSTCHKMACYWHAVGMQYCYVVPGTEAALARALLVAKVAAAMADRSPEAVAQDLPEAVQLAELLLTCLSSGTTSCCTIPT